MKIEDRWIREDIIIMEKILGREMRKDEFVHHKNGMVGDSRPENIELWTRDVPPFGARVADMIEYCKDFLVKYDGKVAEERKRMDMNSISDLEKRLESL